VPGEAYPRVVDHAFVHRRGDHRVVLAGEAPVDRAVEHLQDVAAVGGLEPARLARRRERHMVDVRTPLQQAPVADGDELRAAEPARHRDAQLRPDARRLARGEGDPRHRSSSRSST
jgi:hypothetical protein